MLPHIHPFGISISMYWLCGVIALLAGGALVFAKRRAFGISKPDLLQALARVVIGVVAGSKAFHMLGAIIQRGSEPEFWTLGNWMRELRAGGVFYGGLVGAAVLVLLYAKRHQVPLGNITDLMTFFALMFGAVARFGCLFAGCCYGKEASWGIVIGGVTRLPFPLFETGLNLAILSVFLLWKPERKRPCTLFPLYLILYSAGRFVLEFLRGDESRGELLMFSTSQWIAIVLVIAASIILNRMNQGKKQTSQSLVAAT